MRTMTLPVKLTTGEIALKSSELALEHKVYSQAEEGAKKSAAEWKAKLKDSRAKMDLLAIHIRTGHEDRKVEVEERPEPRNHTVQTVRLDTLEVVEARAMSADELLDLRQPKLFDVNKAKKEKPKA